MKRHSISNQYYKCSSEGYIKFENVPVDHLPIVNQIPVASRCNEILPYQLHKLQIKEPLMIHSARELGKEIPHSPVSLPFKLPKREDLIDNSVSLPFKQPKREDLIGYSVSSSIKRNPKMLEKDEVRSIHLEEKSNVRIRTIQNSIDLTKSLYAYLGKNQSEMKKSLFSTTQTQDLSSKQNLKLSMISSELKKEKEKREQLQRKYETLISFVNKIQKASPVSDHIQKESTLQAFQVQSQQKGSSQNKSESKKKRKNGMIKHIEPECQSDTESESSQQQQEPIYINYQKSKRKGSSPSPVIINLGSQIVRKKPSRKIRTLPLSDSQEDSCVEFKSNLSQIKQQVQILQQNIDFLEKKMNDQENKHQKELLTLQIKEKQRKIEQMAKENRKIKQIYEILVSKKVAVQTAEKGPARATLQTNPIVLSFLFSFLMILLILNLRSAIC